MAKKLVSLLAIVVVATSFGCSPPTDAESTGEAAKVPSCVWGFCKGEIPDMEGRVVISVLGTKKAGMNYATVHHGSFDKGVTVFWTENQGVCAVMGQMTANEMFDLSQMIDLLDESLIQKYGEPKRNRLLQRLRWSSGEGSKLPNGLLTIVATRPTQGPVKLEYKFTNYPQCEEEGKAEFGADL